MPLPLPLPDPRKPTEAGTVARKDGVMTGEESVDAPGEESCADRPPISFGGWARFFFEERFDFVWTIIGMDGWTDGRTDRHTEGTSK